MRWFVGIVVPGLRRLLLQSTRGFAKRLGMPAAQSEFFACRNRNERRCVMQPPPYSAIAFCVMLLLVGVVVMIRLLEGGDK